MTDPLTGLGNRRALGEWMRRRSAEATVAILDLDHFKRFNDEFGHQDGDRLLRDLAVAWSGAIRPGDLLARYGGEEFTLVLSDTGLPEALETVQRLRELVPADQTCSAGVALWDGEEQGLMGSRAYVKRHLAPSQDANERPQNENVYAYFNLDNGAGRVRGVWAQGNLGAMPLLADWLSTVSDLGAGTVGRRSVGGSDHTPSRWSRVSRGLALTSVLASRAKPAAVRRSATRSSVR